LGYFAIEKSLDYWHVTGSSSLRIIRNTIQVTCAHESDNVMFLRRARRKVKYRTSDAHKATAKRR
jgi:hypothetical protein